jgi:hypothetical protein
VRRGASYVTDDLVVTDGARLWGVPRAIQFDPIAAVDAVPPWLEETDRCSYPLRLFGDRRGFLPLVQLEAGRIAFESHSVRGVHLVLPKRGAKTELRSTHHLEGLAAIQSGVIGAIRTNLGGLVGPGRVTRLNWSSPDDAIEMLWATLSDDPC